jgi:hypothetical protein
MRIDYSTTTSNAAFGRYVGDCDLSFRGDLDLVRLWSPRAQRGSSRRSGAARAPAR